MSEPIFIVDVEKNTPPLQVSAVSFSELGIRERQHLEEWVAGHPAVLGEPLLILTTEFDKFDRSDRRIDLLALDEEGILVVIELKLDVAGSLADLQALRYAAFCSTMTMQDAVRMLATWKSITEAEATTKIREFLGCDTLPELNNRPRIILAAGSMDDEEVTSTVLWLRGFGVDIACVELTPYRLPATGQIALVPRTIIPIPEAKDYLVKVERKEVAVAKRDQQNEYFPLWSAVMERFNALAVNVSGRDFRVRRPSKTNFLQVRWGPRDIHYEWVLRFRQNSIDVAIHSELADALDNENLVSALKGAATDIGKDIRAQFHAGAFGDGAKALDRKWREVRLRLVFDDPASPQHAEEAANTMKMFVERTFPLLPAEIVNAV